MKVQCLLQQFEVEQFVSIKSSLQSVNLSTLRLQSTPESKVSVGRRFSSSTVTNHLVER